MQWKAHGTTGLWTSGDWSIERMGEKFELYVRTEVPYTPKFGGMPTTLVQHKCVKVCNSLDEAKSAAEG